eukprot:SAG11_NODE_2378_length_3435_cov_4.530576_3_plen_401_part_00
MKLIEMSRLLPPILLQLVLPAAAAAAALPLCTSCSGWCAGSCSFPGPPLDVATPNPRVRQNITLYRMTAANVTDLDDKDTGDPAGDLVFNMDERAIPLVCRHSKTASTNPDCIAGNTHSWLLDSNLVYLQWTIEVSGVWGPYQMCNLNLTDRATGQPGDGRWFCDGARFDRSNFTDSKLCGTCGATKRAVGWAAMNSSSPPSSAVHVPSAACNVTFKGVCGDTLDNYSACRACGARNYKFLLENISDCNWSELCAPPVSEVKRPVRALFIFSTVVTPFFLQPPASAACEAAAAQLCGALRKPDLHHSCATCLRNHSYSLERGPCPGGQYQALVPHARGGSEWCPSPNKTNWYNSRSNATWLGPQSLHPNHRLVSAVLPLDLCEANFLVAVFVRIFFASLR